MKKITFILLALISGTAFGQATTITTAAEIVEAVKFSEISGLDFGKLDNSAGTYSISANGIEAGSKSQVLGGVAAPAELKVTGKAGQTYGISFTAGETGQLTGPSGATAMTVSDLDFNGTQTLDTNGEETINIGGKVTVNADQTVGAYTGTIEVTVSYN